MPCIQAKPLDAWIVSASAIYPWEHGYNYTGIAKTSVGQVRFDVTVTFGDLLKYCFNRHWMVSGMLEEKGYKDITVMSLKDSSYPEPF